MRVKHKVIVKVSDDADMKDLLFSTDEQLAEVVIDAWTKSFCGKVTVALNTTENLSLGDIGLVKGLYLKVNKDVVIKFNGSADSMTLKRAGSTTNHYAKLFLEAAITQVNIAAPVTEDASILYCIWGVDSDS
jgi:hypothetical protein